MSRKNHPDKIVIVLTTTVNVHDVSFLHQKSKKERISTYLKSILQWLTTKFYIVVVENSGYKFNELNFEKEKYKHRFEIISFQESNKTEANYLKTNKSKGAHELFAIDYAYYHSRLLQQFDVAIKITGRYFIPNFKLKKTQFKALRQFDKTRCEIVGSNQKYFPYIFNKYNINNKGEFYDHVEDIYAERIAFLDSVYVLPQLQIDPTPRGGINEIMTML